MIRRLLKDFLCLMGLGSYLVEYCDDCGIRQPLVWWCDDQELWNSVTGGYGSHCPECFNQRAERMGILLQWKTGIHP